MSAPMQPAPQTGAAAADNIRVYCRVRGGGSAARSAGGVGGGKTVTSVSDGRVVTVGKHAFSFSWAGDADASQEAVYEAAGRPLTEAFLTGFNACIFAFGQTGSGKTHTIHGARVRRRAQAARSPVSPPPPPPQRTPPPTHSRRPPLPHDTGSDDDSTNAQRGLLPRCIEQIFEVLAASPGGGGGGGGGDAPEASTVLKASYLEVRCCAARRAQRARARVGFPHRHPLTTPTLLRCPQIYNERIFDLCAEAPSGGEEAPSLALRESSARGVYVEGLTETPVTSVAAARALLAAGAKNRRVSATAMNHESSRSHSVFTLTMERAERAAGGAAVRSRSAAFHLIDLAGSERQKAAQTSGERLREASQINKSLSALAGVIGALVDLAAGRARHVHYRDSKLTYLLRDSLGGNARTSIIATVSPSDDCYPETLATLKFAESAKLVTNRAVVNENTTGTVCQLQAEIRGLRAELQEYKCASSRRPRLGGRAGGRAAPSVQRD